MSTKIENVETFVNEFWMFEGEPFHIVRYKCEGVSYLCGFSKGMLILNSLSIAASSDPMLTPLIAMFSTWAGFKQRELDEKNRQ